MKKTIGILAHVDAGKTTFSEQLLYHTHRIRMLGKVDDGTTALDIHEIERARGITIFADQTWFSYEGDTYYLIDTPGHVDFSAETERTLQILDYAILLIGGMAGVQSHTLTLFHLLERYQIPVFLFINKCDREGFELPSIIEQLNQKLTPHLLLLSENTSLEDLAQAVAEQKDEFIEPFLEGNYSETEVIQHLRQLIKDRQLFPVCSGSALKDRGIDNFLKQLHHYTETYYENQVSFPLEGMIYKIRHDKKNNRISFLKLLSGMIHIKDLFSFGFSDGTEKIQEIRLYSGEKFTPCQEASAGDVVAVTGFQTPICGSYLGKTTSTAPFMMQPALQSNVVIQDQTNINDFLPLLKQLETEDPTLNVEYLEELQEIRIHIMGKIQLEILGQLILDRFGICVSFEKPQVLYQETIQSPVMGYGHFEPLRHYAEVNLRLEPAPRGSGISFSSECPVDDLSINYQKLIQTHVFEKVHKGILTGSPLTDVSIVLTAGRSHIKHTEGGDFREATYRSIRQGLEKAENILLEPYYRFEIQADRNYLGKILSDLQKRSCAFDPPETIVDFITVRGKGPVSTLMDYPIELMASTKGTGNISVMIDGYRECHNSKEIIAAIGYQKEEDRKNPSGSVFCAKGTSFLVSWENAENYMHCINR